jgi:hypothetical protein
MDPDAACNLGLELAKTVRSIRIRHTSNILAEGYESKSNQGLQAGRWQESVSSDSRDDYITLVASIKKWVPCNTAAVVLNPKQHNA